MVDSKWIDDRHGMSLNEGPHPSRDNENGVLFYLEYILIKEMKGEDVSSDVAKFKEIIETVRSYDANGDRIMGLYDRGEKESLRENKEDIRTISHDNLTAIASFSYRYDDGKEGHSIAKHGLKNLLRYDNAYPESPRFSRVHWPTDLAYWAITSKKWYYLPLIVPIFPFFVMRSILSNLSKPGNTSGKLLNFVRAASFRDKGLIGKLMWKLHVSMMRYKYGDNWLHEIMKIYFLNPNHPNRVESATLKL